MPSFTADSVKISTRESDNTSKIQFSTGEYQLNEVMEAFMFAQKAVQSGVAVRVSVEEVRG